MQFSTKFMEYRTVSLLQANRQCEKLFKLNIETPLCSSTAEICIAAKTRKQCMGMCLELGESCMKLTAQEYDGHCLMSSSVTTEPCNTTAEGTTFIVTQLSCPKPEILTITAGVDENVAAG